MRIDIHQVSKRFGAFTALASVDLSLADGELVALLGPSGSGKTTLLRIIAGLEWPDEGQVFFNGDDALAHSARERHVGFVFQHYALFRHMTVFDNVAFGLRVRPRAARLPHNEIRSRVEALLDLVQLKWLADRYPHQLSGGQRQRIALARALAIEPRVLLLDEPFGALDAKVRVELRRSLRDIHDATGLTTVFVTHDQEEALDLADRVAVMNHGRIEQIGTPTEIYEEPRTPFVFDFLGRTNSFACEIGNGQVRLGDKVLDVEPGTPDGPAVAFVRPHDIVLSSPVSPQPNGDAMLPGTAVVRFISALGQRAAVELLYERKLIEAESSRDRLDALGLHVGSRCTISLRLPRIYSKADADKTAGTEGGQRPRLRIRRRQRAA